MLTKTYKNKSLNYLNSKIIKALKIDLNNMKMEDLINFIKNNPSILKRPIIMDEHHFLVGYNEEEIRIFIPRSQRRLFLIL